MLSVGDYPSSILVKDAKRKIRVGMVLDQPFPGNSRVEREATALTEAGFEVHLLCVANRADALADIMMDEAYRGFYIHRVDPDEVTIEIPFFQKQSRFLYKGALKNYFQHFKNIDTVWHTLIHRFAKTYDIQILHVHDLRLVDTALSIACRYGIPLVADMHEHYPALMQMRKARYDAERDIWQGDEERERWEKIETESLQRATRVLTTTQEAKTRLIDKGLSEDKLLALDNTISPDEFHAMPTDQEVVRLFRPLFVLTFVGAMMDESQGIQTIIEAMALLKDEIPELHFIAAGPIKESYHAWLEHLVVEAGLRDRVHFTGGLEKARLGTYIEASDVCLCPHLANDYTNVTFPELLYLCHLFKKPLITSDAAPLQRYVESTAGGLAFESENPQMLAELIRLLHSRPDVRKELSVRGYQAILERYNWECTSRSLIAMYRQLVGQFIRQLA